MAPRACSVSDTCRTRIVPRSVQSRGANAPIKPAALTTFRMAVHIPYRTLNCSDGRDAFNWPTKMAPMTGTYGQVWFACWCPDCPCAPDFACRGAGGMCVDARSCACYVTVLAKTKAQTGAQVLSLKGCVQRQGLAGPLGAGDVPSDCTGVVLAGQPPPPAGPPPQQGPGTACAGAVIVRAQPSPPTGAPPAMPAAAQHGWHAVPEMLYDTVVVVGATVVAPGPDTGTGQHGADTLMVTDDVTISC